MISPHPSGDLRLHIAGRQNQPVEVLVPSCFYQDSGFDDRNAPRVLHLPGIHRFLLQLEYGGMHKAVQLLKQLGRTKDLLSEPFPVDGSVRQKNPGSESVYGGLVSGSARQQDRVSKPVGINDQTTQTLQFSRNKALARSVATGQANFKHRYIRRPSAFLPNEPY